MPLTDTAIRNAKPADKPAKLADARGLFLLIHPNGGKWWRFSYRFDSKQKTLSMGTYPDVSLAKARTRRDEARTLLADGIDPGANRKAAKASKTHGAMNSFEVVAREWFAKFSPGWAVSHSSKIMRRLEMDVFPWLGGLPIAAITAPQLLEVVRRIEGRGALETARRALFNCGQAFRYAVATGRAERDPTADLRGSMPKATKTHHAAIIEPKAIGELLRTLAGYQGSYVTCCALRLAPLLFVRPGELRKAEWAEMNLEAAEWRLPASRMKMKQGHIVPLSSQAVAILTELHLLTGRGKYVFPGARTRDRMMSENTVNAALRRLGYAKDEMSGHGFRAMARTILDEVLGVRPDFIEHQLAHAVRDPNGRAYNRTAHLAERRKMMQQWADYLDTLKAGAEVIPVRRNVA